MSDLNKEVEEEIKKESDEASVQGGSSKPPKEVGVTGGSSKPPKENNDI